MPETGVEPVRLAAVDFESEYIATARVPLHSSNSHQIS